MFGMIGISEKSFDSKTPSNLLTKTLTFKPHMPKLKKLSQKPKIMPTKKQKPAELTIYQFREWGRMGGRKSAKTNSKRLKELHAKRAVDKLKETA